jgi:hypothetical protein
VHNQSQVPGGVILPPPEPEQLDLQLPFIQSGLSPLAEGLEFLVQSVEKSRFRHLDLRSGYWLLAMGYGLWAIG